MPITAWKCAGCGGREVPLNHFATSPCGYEWVAGKPPVHPSFAAAVLHHDRTHYSRGTGVVSVTMGLGCPREVGIMAKENVAVDPLMYNAPQGGTAWHEMVQKAHDAALEGPFAESSVVAGLIIEQKVTGRLAMVPLQGKPDCLRPASLIIDDWKTKKDDDVKDIRSGKKRPDPDHIAQLSMYAALVEQHDGWRPKRGILWYRSHRYGMEPIEVGLWDEAQVLAYKPASGTEYTVTDLLRAADGVLRGVTKWEALPLVGKTMSYGPTSKCDWCPVRDVCWTQAGGAPF